MIFGKHIRPPFAGVRLKRLVGAIVAGDGRDTGMATRRIGCDLAAYDGMLRQADHSEDCMLAEEAVMHSAGARALRDVDDHRDGELALERLGQSDALRGIRDGNVPRLSITSD